MGDRLALSLTALLAALSDRTQAGRVWIIEGLDVAEYTP
jgi:hypothetical protein